MPAAQDDQPAWELISQYSASAAQSAFDSEHAPDTLKRRLGLAVVYLGKYPQTPGNIDRAEELLLSIVETRDQTELKAAAYYLLARIAHIFRVGQAEQAELYYQQVRAEYPGSLLADNTAVKLALLKLNQLPQNLESAGVRVAIDQLAVPERKTLLSQFHQAVANYLLERDDLELAFACLQKCRDLNVAVGNNRADLRIQLGRVGTLLKEREVAISAYREFVQDFPNDSRHFMVKEELKRLLEDDSS